MHKEKTKLLRIRTPEGVEFSLLLAGITPRFLACTIDFVAKMVLYNIVGLSARVFVVISQDFAMAFAIIIYFIISIGYSILLEWFWQGQTIGKRLFRLRVVDAQGLHIHFSQIVIRNLLRFVDSVPLFYMVGSISCFVSKKSQRFGDLVANTIVVRSPRILEPDLAQIFQDKYNSLRQHSHLCARLRQNVTPQEADIAMQALMRRDEFSPEDRVELFSQISSYFKSIVEFPAEVVDGISDEQYVRNVADILFRSNKEVAAV